MITVREARPGDGRLLMTTTQQLAELHGMGEHFVATPDKYETALFCEHPIVGALVAEIDGVFAGSIFWHRSFSTNSGREIIYLEDIIVLEQHRRKGVARALMKELARVAIKRNTYAFFWLMAQWNEGAEQFYRSLGAKIEKDFAVCSVRDDALEALAQ